MPSWQDARAAGTVPAPAAVGGAGGHAGRRGRLRVVGERHHQAQVGRVRRPGRRVDQGRRGPARPVRDRRPQPGPAGHRQGGDVDDPAVAAAGGDHPAAGRRARPGPGPLLLGRRRPGPQERRRRPRLVLGRITGDEEDLDARAAASPTPTPATTPTCGSIRDPGVPQGVGEQVEADVEARPSPSPSRCCCWSWCSPAPPWPRSSRWPSTRFAIVGTLLVLRVLAQVADVHLRPQPDHALGLGLAIDYSLFIVSRYQEGLPEPAAAGDALIVTMRTAGRTPKCCSAPPPWPSPCSPCWCSRSTSCGSFGYAGIAVVALAAVGALVRPPALLACSTPGRPFPAHRPSPDRCRPIRGALRYMSPGPRGQDRGSGTGSPPG